MCRQGELVELRKGLEPRRLAKPKTGATASQNACLRPPCRSCSRGCVTQAAPSAVQLGESGHRPPNGPPTGAKAPPDAQGGGPGLDATGAAGAAAPARAQGRRREGHRRRRRQRVVHAGWANGALKSMTVLQQRDAARAAQTGGHAAAPAAAPRGRRGERVSLAQGTA